ncbi:hypothetical protein [Mycolicibacterium sp. HK-90]|uniref:hypothetical protein n=1 Tax=Mycolicibacterium sp. HK-90 TaxID=3056937 RepID=UPI0026580D64|nr:hypothetical protein [Mycolicibacterium sp. HK-90]WKG04907.1 hypothetical protein QU592_07410 [Mycolicibacterium sp. HK-90]
MPDDVTRVPAAEPAGSPALLVRKPSGVPDFEVYQLLTMKWGMIPRRAMIDWTLTEYGISTEDAQRIHQRVAGLLEDEDARFENLKQVVGVAKQDSTSLSFSSVLWPGFEFTAGVGADGLLATAQYRRAGGHPLPADSPGEQPTWSMDTAEFIEHFGPATLARRSSRTDDVLPAHEVYDFEWNGRRYGAGFSWGMFLLAGQYWD